MSSQTQTNSNNALGKFFQVIDRRDSHYRKVGTVIAMHQGSQFPVCVQFHDGNNTGVYHAYQLRRVMVKQPKQQDASV